jgi:hypothetical protein
MPVSINHLPLRSVLCCAALVLQSFGAAASAAEQPAREETWQVIYLSGQRIGYSRSVIENVSQDGGTIVKTSSISNMSFKRFGQTLIMKQSLSTEETTEGDLRRFRFETANPPAMTAVTTGKIVAQELTLTQEINGKARTTVQPWQNGVKSPVFQDRLLKANPLKPGETRSFDSFVPEFAKVGKATLKAIDFEKTKLLNDVPRKLFKVSSTHSLLPGIVMNNFLDNDGDTLKVSTNMLGSTMELFQVSKDEALKTIEGAELDLAVSTLVKVKPLAKGHETQRVVYRVTIADQDPCDVIPVGDTQKIKRLDDETAELTVISIPIPRTAKIGNVAPEFLESSQYLQRDDELVQKHANRAAGDATDPAVIARRMETYVLEKLTSKNFSTAMASAAEVAKSLEGDCTEHAVLLAAMLRAKQIPSRIVVGLVYAERMFAFGGHMWTEAYLNDQWIPLDATLGLGGIGAAHIKLATSSLSDDGPAAISGFAPLMSVIGKLKLEVISAE